ncbi:HlyD family secretion protein [Hyalangium rubrum]|uniref:HlyD family efflux transporter periplasmic adaptor subunit n=1 Tax=Hyalangium rubrum TaxID=3103134 RepID=A0ABU5H3V5_9BACT|nr:HlyD family efflux transporter periplasmic adaptor subunit [Hyalangium sp. s54d21]MDY7228156.1 HlyD family efflux transporter periplasmic adaptor subunit [Hyalangium sp. s54d21]
MSYDFRDSLSALEDRGRHTVAIGTVLVVLAIWSAWLVLGRVSLYVTSSSSRIEVAGAAFPVEPTVPGRVVSSSLQLGQRVRKGDVLVRLEAREQEYLLNEQKARREALEQELAALGTQLEAENKALEGVRQLADASRGESSARRQEAAIAAQEAAKEAERLQPLLEKRFISAAEYEAKVHAAGRQRASSRAAGFSSERSSAEMRVSEGDRIARIAELERQSSNLLGERNALDAAIPRLQAELDKRVIVAPADGTIGSVMAIQQGMNLTAGQRLATVVPEGGDLQIVAYLPAPEALGRVREGQQARLRLDGFPWTQYGAIEARVVRVAEEDSEGKIRVELGSLSESVRTVALKHGLTGSLEVQVDRLSPLSLVFRRLAGSVG